MLRLLRLAALAAIATWVLLATLPAGLWSDVTGFFTGAISDVGKAIRAVEGAVRSVVDFFGHLGQHVNDAWNWMVNGVEWLGDRAARIGGSVFNIGKWLITRWVPMAAHWALGKAAALALGLYHTVGKFITGLVNSVIRWVRGLLHDVWHFITHMWNVLWGAIVKAANWIAHATFYVFDLLAHPDRLATWIAGHIIEPVIRWLVNSGAGVIRWIAKQAAALMGDFAHVLERALAGIL